MTTRQTRGITVGAAFLPNHLPSNPYDPWRKVPNEATLRRRGRRSALSVATERDPSRAAPRTAKIPSAPRSPRGRYMSTTILILTRTELMDGSIKHLSLSVRQIRIGFITDIFDDLDERREKRLTEFQFPACCDARPTPTESSAKRESHEGSFECSLNMVSAYSPWNHTSPLSSSYHSSCRSGRI